MNVKVEKIGKNQSKVVVSGRLDDAEHVVHPSKVSFAVRKGMAEVRQKERSLVGKYAKSGFACTPFERMCA